MTVNVMKEMLSSKGWENKIPLYAQYFEEARVLHKILQPVMSVVVISWRRHPDTIKNFIKLQMQAKQYPFELIFVNNGASEEEFSDLLPYVNTYIRLNTNTGAYLARNIGAAFAESPIILFLEDDGIPDDQLIESHLMIHRKYDVYAVRGVYLFKTENTLNHRQLHYYLGHRFFPLASNLEGNSSYDAKVFFEVGGWDDEIQFGGGGRELALRIFKKYPKIEKQIYSPISIIYHDYATSEEHLKTKWIKQQQSFQRLSTIHKEWHEFNSIWDQFYGDTQAIAGNEKLEPDFHVRFDKMAKEILIRNKNKIEEYEKSRIFSYDAEKLRKITNIPDKHICIFGSGSFGGKFLDKMNQYGLRVDCFADNNEELWGTDKFGIKVISPEELNENHLIFIASMWYFDIFQQLLGKGLQPGRHFFIVN